MHRLTPPGSAQLRAAAALGALAAVILFLVVADWRPLISLDRSVARGLHGAALDHPFWTDVNRVLTDWVWDPWTMRLLLALVVLWLLWRGDRLVALWIAGTAAATAAVQQGLKAAVGRDRPVWERPVDSAQYAAMPSGHVMTAAATCVLLLWLLHGLGVRGAPWRAALAVAAVSVAGVAFTRVWTGVHWLTDTLVGGLLGLALPLAALAVGSARYDLRARPPKTATSSGSPSSASGRQRGQDTTPGSRSS
ncbi:phosphatase PAP2 family protein [Streptomyces sp. NPDC048172]|uniref:phosphatase PAP2 family protein n=1 Tax=Streptomyces sp. NPDC048172 TaxID=3365505 RepID=UPI003722B86E